MLPSGAWFRLRRWLTSGVIVLVLAIVLCDALPCTPDALQAISGPFASRLGIGQGRWTMFTPPDGDNHRLRAELLLRDGRTVEWRSPDLAQQSVWQRFAGHRRSEYVDNAITFGQQYSGVWDSFAAWLVERHAHEGGGVARIRIIVELAPVPPPTESPWKPRAADLPFSDQRVVYTRKFP